VTDALLIETLVVIAASIAATGMLAWARVPPVLGYLLAGLLIGPHGLQILAAGAETKFLAELGGIFLMFMVGLEFSIPAMFEARREVLTAGGRQGRYHDPCRGRRHTVSEL
jgi:monovalent cation:H+ antiporter-2, CPA2 family